MPEIYQQTKFITCGIQVIQYLRSVFISNFIHSFDFNNDFIVTDEIRFIFLLQHLVAIT